MHCIILTVESIMFGLIVAAILSIQLQAIFGDETAVEQVQNQGPYRPLKPKYVLMSEVCGRTHPALWLLPCSRSGSKKYFDAPLLTHEV